MTDSTQQKMDDFKFKKNDIENQTQKKLKIVKDSTQGEIVDLNSETKNENVNISKSISELPLKDFNILSETQQPNINNVPGKKTKKYQISTNSNSILVLPENYSTDDEDEYKAILDLNEDLSSWKKMTDKEGLKIQYKPFHAKDEKGNDVESVKGYSNWILDFPGSKVISKINDYEFRS